MNKFITIDIEGDISSKYCREDFTEDTLYRDPDTIMWLCSFYDGKSHKAYGIRLPSKPRHYFSPVKGIMESTMQYHEQTNVFPPEVEDYGACEKASDYRNFLEAIAKVINLAYKEGYKVYFKGYKEKGKRDSYDREILSTLMKKFGVQCNLECLIDVYDEYPGFWMKKTYPQKGQNTSNQIWMNNAIKHNLEDSKELWNAVWRRKQSVTPVKV